jgi:hypothetical protein
VSVEDRAHSLNRSTPIAVDGGEPLARSAEQMPSELLAHSVRVRDRRRRFGDEHVFSAECACGWRGDFRTGVTAERVARRDGDIHLDGYRPPHGHRGRS